MGATYTRQSSSGITDGAVIEASDLNNEFDQLLAAFVAASGHTHDGTAAEGGPITKLLGTSLTIGDGTSGTDITVTFDGETNDGVITWMEDEDLFKFSDAINVGVDDTGYDVKFFGATSGKYWLWDESADGVVQIGSLTVGVDDAGHDVKFFGDTASAYMLWDTSADDLVLAGSAGIDLAGDIDVDGTANLDNTDIDGTLAVDGTTISLDATTSLNIDNSNTSNGITIGTATSGVPISIGHSTSEVTINDNLTVTGTLTLGSGAELAEAELEMLDGITAGTVAASKAVVVDGNKDAASFRNVTLTGELDGGSLDISGDADIDGTANLDAVDIDGAVQIDNTVTVGVNDTGYDVKFFGATSGAYMLWDESTDDLVLAGAAKLYLYDAAGGEYLSSSGSALTIASGGTAWELPAADGSDGQLLKTDGSGNLDWTTVSGTITALNNQSANRLTTIGSTTTELDGEANLTFTGSALTCIGTITVGVDDTGHDVKFFGATAGSYALWDESADSLLLTDSTPLKIGDSQDLTLYHDGTNSYITNAQGALKIATETSGIAVTIGHTTSEVTVADNLTVTGTLTGTLATAAQGNVTSLGTLTTLTVDNIIANGTTIGHTDDTDLMTLADGVLTVAGEVSATTLDIGGTNISSTATELNLLDGSAKSTSSITLADTDAIIVIDGTTTKQIPVSDIKTYNPGGTAWQAVVTGNTTMTAGRGYFVNTTSAAITMTLPAGSIGDQISLIDYAGTFDSNNLTVAANGSEKIHGSTDDLTVATERAAFTLVFTDSTQGWLLTNN